MGYLEEQYLPDTNIVLLRVDFHDDRSRYHDMSTHSYSWSLQLRSSLQQDIVK